MTHSSGGAAFELQVGLKVDPENARAVMARLFAPVHFISRKCHRWYGAALMRQTLHAVLVVLTATAMGAEAGAPVNMCADSTTVAPKNLHSLFATLDCASDPRRCVREGEKLADHIASGCDQVRCAALVEKTLWPICSKPGPFQLRACLTIGRSVGATELGYRNARLALEQACLLGQDEACREHDALDPVSLEPRADMESQIASCNSGNAFACYQVGDFHVRGNPDGSHALVVAGIEYLHRGCLLGSELACKRMAQSILDEADAIEQVEGRLGAAAFLRSQMLLLELHPDSMLAVATSASKDRQCELAEQAYRALERTCAKAAEGAGEPPFRALVPIYNDLETVGGCAEVISGLGVVAYLRGHHRKSTELHERAMAFLAREGTTYRDHVFAKTRADILYNLALVAVASGAWAQANEHLKKAFSLEPDLVSRARNDPGFSRVREIDSFQRMLNSRR